MLSLLVAAVLAGLVMVYADDMTGHDGLAIALRLAALVLFVLWMLNVFGAITLPLDPW